MIHPNGVRSELFIHSIDLETKTVTLAHRLAGEAYVENPGSGGVIENLTLAETGEPLRIGESDQGILECPDEDEEE